MSDKMNRKQATKKVADALIQIGLGIEAETINTETELWPATKLSILNAILDTMVPGARLTFIIDHDTNKSLGISYIRQLDNYEERPRNLSQSLRDIADCLDGENHE